MTSVRDSGQSGSRGAWSWPSRASFNLGEAKKEGLNAQVAAKCESKDDTERDCECRTPCSRKISLIQMSCSSVSLGATDSVHVCAVLVCGERWGSGRKRTLVFSAVCHLIGVVGTGFATATQEFLILRLLIGLAVGLGGGGGEEGRCRVSTLHW